MSVWLHLSKTLHEVGCIRDNGLDFGRMSDYMQEFYSVAMSNVIVKRELPACSWKVIIPDG